MAKPTLKCIRPRQWLTATIIQCQELENSVVLVWVVDSGTHNWHKIFQKYRRSNVGKLHLDKLFESLGIGYEFNKEDPIDSFEHFLVGKRAELDLDYRFSEIHNAFINFVIDYRITTKKPDIDPTKPPDDSHFFKHGNKKELPIKFKK